MVLNLADLPERARLEITKSDLLAFAHTLIAENTAKTTPPSVSTKDMMTIEETSEFLNLARQTLYGMTSKREIPHLKKNRKVYFLRSELETWMSEGRQKTQKELASDANTANKAQKEKRQSK